MPLGSRTPIRKGALQNKNTPLREFRHLPITDPRNPSYWLLDYYRTIFNPIRKIDQQPARKALTAKGARNRELSKDKRRGINRLTIPPPQAQPTPSSRSTSSAAPTGLNLGVSRLLSVGV